MLVKGRLLLVLDKLGFRIREERQRVKLTQEQLAELAGCNESYIGQIERGEKNPSLEILVHIANALNVTMDYLLADNVKVNQINGLLAELINLTNDRDPDDVRFIITVNRLFLDLLDKKEKNRRGKRGARE